MKRSDILDNSMGKGVLAEINEMNRYIDFLEEKLSALNAKEILRKRTSCSGCEYDDGFKLEPLCKLCPTTDFYLRHYTKKPSQW